MCRRRRRARILFAAHRTAETWKATSIPRAPGMWYVYKCVCSTRSRTRSSFTRPTRGQSRYTYTHRHYNSVITANHSYTEERVPGHERYTVIIDVSLRYTYIISLEANILLQFFYKSTTYYTSSLHDKFLCPKKKKNLCSSVKAR